MLPAQAAALIPYLVIAFLLEIYLWCVTKSAAQNMMWSLVCMGGKHICILTAQHLVRQLFPYLVGFLIAHFSGSKGLYQMMCQMVPFLPCLR